MIEINTIGVWGFEGAIRGCRMPYESFDKSDSNTCTYCAGDDWQCPYVEDVRRSCYNGFIFGEDDMTLAKKLIKGGSEHRKFLRMIHIQAEIRAPRYFIVELATYKIGTTMNSSSTMHLITKRELTENDITHDGMSQTRLEAILREINMAIRSYNKESDKLMKDMTFREIKQMLPEGFMQAFIWDADYETLINIYRQRKNHRLQEWRDFSRWIESLPYMKEFLEVKE